MPAPTHGSIRDIVKQRIIAVVREVKAADSMKVLILDTPTLKTISAVCRTMEIIEEGVSLLENLERRRQPMPGMQAIYIIHPNEDSIEKVKNDFKSAQDSMYAGAHIYLTSHISNDLIYSMRQCNELVQRTKSLKELNFEFVALESQVRAADETMYVLIEDMQCYSLGLHDAFRTLYSPVTVAKNAMIHTIADRMLTLCVTLGEFPNITYKKAASAEFDMVEKIAKALQVSLSNFDKQIVEGNSWWQPKRSEPANILIVDRRSEAGGLSDIDVSFSFDALTPLMHEYTYQARCLLVGVEGLTEIQAMVYDLMEMKDSKYKYTTSNAKGEDVEKVSSLDESDALWVQLRHMHIADAINFVIDEFNRFVQQNKAANMAKGEAKSLRDLSEAIKSMPQFKDRLAKYSLHMDLTKKCMALYEQKFLEKISTEEQNMATGADAQGKALKTVQQSVMNVLQDEHISEKDKLRLILIYVISQEGLSEADVDKLVSSAHLQNTSSAQRIVQNLKHLNVTLKQAQAKPKGMISSGMTAASKLFPFIKADSDKKRPKMATDVGYDLSRYRPPLQYIIQDALEGKLDPNEYVTTAPTSSKSQAETNSNGPSRNPRNKASWADKSAIRRDEPKEASKSKAGPRLIVLVVGGLAYSELRAAYEMTTKEIIIGSTEMMAPEAFLDSLAVLSEPTV
ncbi:Sec1 family protein A [Guillardia theta CCMP2712]|uniref:Sec1 family protein A n=1 Tax=Guillardia theta (strain CCMP2712) TaxID=905079 RepID=L1K4R3_GUITC|nr:Sec1 family protein A [Guillardia theta CCMP2712]EKX55455.1 Sec1 family protein A [Guillardia theta CCMP2712]|eukprot:XP_005842435.1 Sec1 family protein A [Guillardia theta CCMP2712]